jgi:AAA15 family ATPase/GTPase
MGKLWNSDKDVPPLTKLTAITGKNSTGKSSIFEAFRFIAACLKKGVEEACDERGGFFNIFSKEQPVDEGICFEICYRESDEDNPVTYEISIKTDDSQRPFVFSER